MIRVSRVIRVIRANWVIRVSRVIRVIRVNWVIRVRRAYLQGFSGICSGPLGSSTCTV